MLFYGLENEIGKVTCSVTSPYKQVSGLESVTRDIKYILTLPYKILCINFYADYIIEICSISTFMVLLHLA